MYPMIYQELACMGAMAIDQGGGCSPNTQKTRLWGNVWHRTMGEPGGFLAAELRITKRNMYPMMYQELACMGAMAIDQRGGTSPKNMKNSPMGESLSQNDGTTRWVSGQQS